MFGRWTLFLLFFIFLTLPQSFGSGIIFANPFSSASSNGLSPFWEWRTIESEHFQVVFPKHLKAIAHQATQYLEEAHQLLSPVFNWTPAYKPPVLVIDNYDLANGLTMAVGRFGMVLWSMPPESGSSTNYYDNWLRFLVIHEYTHFLNLDTTSSFWKPLRYVFGDLFLPNSTWAPWMLEGLAVYSETRFTQAGRGRSPYYEMLLRSAVYSNVLSSGKFITIDQVNGSSYPYFPGGDSRYQFGYHLMNQVSLETRTPQHDGTLTLGLLSQESGARVPFFINGNLQNITGKTWLDVWNDWVDGTQKRMKADIQRIQSQPLSSITLLTDEQLGQSNEAKGIALSPDGQWMAYTLESAHRREGLYLRNLKTGKTFWINDKRQGVGMAFTPDSKSLICSELHRQNQYTFYSDLEVYDLQSKSREWLSYNLRARDPDLSRDGEWLAFTVNQPGITSLALAPLLKVGKKFKLGKVSVVFSPQLYDRVANPKFSADGKKVFFSIHVNGKSQEDLMEYDRTTHQVNVLLSDGNYNRFPATDSPGNLYFVSNATGVDNLYRFNGTGKKPSLVSNLVTGISYPTFSLKNPSTYYASLFSYSGWNLAKIDLLSSPVASEKVTVSKPPAPPLDLNSGSKAAPKVYPDQAYSALPSLLPRVWGPVASIDANNPAIGIETLGFDVTDQHRYVVAGSYQPRLGLPNGYALYSNRTLGPTWDLSSRFVTTQADFSSPELRYSRQLSLSSALSYPFLQAYSALTPQIAFNFQRIFRYLKQDEPQLMSLENLASLDATLSFSNEETSPLAVAAEGGGRTQLGSRLYMNQSQPIWKLFFFEQGNFRLTQHTILSPSLKGSWVSYLSSQSPSSSVQVQGRGLQQLLGAFASDGLDQVSIRGYPGKLYQSKAVLEGGLDLRFPIFRIFRGWDTYPLFLQNLYALAFAENTYFPRSQVWLPSAGAGLRVSTEMFFWPVTLSAEFHKGLNVQYGGTNDFFFQVLSQGLSF